MQVERPLFWHQGLFLQPQHLQLADLHQASKIRPLMEYGLPYFWGITGMVIQEAGLANKSFEILQGEFVFQDGTHATFPGNAIIKPRSFDEAWIEGDKPFSIYIGLRKWNPSGANVTAVDAFDKTAGVNTRYAVKSDPEEILDMHGEGPTAHVKRLSHVLRVFWESELKELDDYHLIPVARLERYGEEIRLVRDFIPPCLSFTASDWLVKSMKDIRDQVTSRCRQLEEYKSPREVQGLEMDLGYIVFLLALRSLNRYVPMFYMISETRNMHPWWVYVTLRQMIGELSTFSEGLSATGERSDGTKALPAYDHENLIACFSAAHSLVGQLLDSITVSPGHMIRLDYDGAYYTAEVAESIFDKHNRFWLVLRTEAPEEAIASSIRRLVKLSAKKNMTTLVARAVPGVPLEYFPAPPPGLPRRANSYYLKIDHNSGQWLDVEDSKTISFFWDAPPEDLSVELLIIRS